ncbi:MAG: phage tail sheath C-terminal domain-containing protein, partial [Pseudomonadota bacterium]
HPAAIREKPFDRGMCCVVSVGGYLDHAKGVSLAALKKGLEVAGREGGVTLTVIPEAVQLPSLKDFGALAEAALAQAAELTDRMVLLDVYGMEAVDPSADTWQSDFADVIAAFRKSISSDHLQYGASYTPSLKTSVIAPQGVDYKAFDPAALTQLLTAEAAELYDGAKLAAAKALIAEMPEASGKARVALAQNLRDMLPVQADLEQQVVDVLGVLPPSGLVAGMFVQNDAERGVWNAPASVSMRSVIGPVLPITDGMQEDLNAPMDGKAVNAVRAFPGRGTLVWGARTMDGNSPDWRYIQVRRTIIYIEQTIKTALQPFVFAPNDEDTWASVHSAVSNFLRGVWSDGGLYGRTMSEAFAVQCGLGSTMTAQDLQEGRMIVHVQLQAVRPDEFIVLTIVQQMETS